MIDHHKAGKKMQDNQNEPEMAQKVKVSEPVKQMDISTYLNLIMQKYALYITSPKFLLMAGLFVSVGIITEGFLCFAFCQGLLFMKFLIIIDKYIFIE